MNIWSGMNTFSYFGMFAKDLNIVYALNKYFKEQSYVLTKNYVK